MPAMLATPETSHVPYDRVYEPAEDSFLLLDALSSASESAFLQKRFQDGPSPLVYELGSGSGVVIAFTADHAKAILGRSDALILASDINEEACKATTATMHRTLSANHSHKGVYLSSINANLTDCIRPGSIDIFIFNPPYVPAPLPAIDHESLCARESTPTAKTRFELDSYLLSLSYAGGEDGMEVTNEVLARIPTLLSTGRGVAYVLLCAQNKPAEVMAKIKSWSGGWQAEVVANSGKQAGWERLVIIRIWIP